MLTKIIILLITLCTTRIGSQQVSKYRYDYIFSEKADGWLKLHRMPATWSDAMHRCYAEGAILASPLTTQLQEAIFMHASNKGINAIFTGVNSVYSQGDFASIEGIPLSKLVINWSPDEPNNVGGVEDCLAMMIKDSGRMADVKCTKPLPYVCYKKRTEIVLTECGTPDKEYKLDIRTGSCYKLHRLGLEWSQAYMTCVAEGGHLAIINSGQESTALQELFNQYKNEDIFSKNTGASHIGFRDMRNGGSWKTIHGETLDQAGFSRWSEGQPDNSTAMSPEGESCGSVHRDGLLNDMWCGLTAAFICEKKPDSLLAGP